MCLCPQNPPTNSRESPRISENLRESPRITENLRESGKFVGYRWCLDTISVFSPLSFFCSTPLLVHQPGSSTDHPLVSGDLLPVGGQGGDGLCLLVDWVRTMMLPAWFQRQNYQLLMMVRSPSYATIFFLLKNYIPHHTIPSW
jgi:hypothetical protein